MKHAILILDGAAGWPLAQLGGATTLAAAHTPNLDALARQGTVGLAQTVPPGLEPSSAAACTAIMGYDPAIARVGRGAIEAASMGIALAPDEVALRINLVAIENGVMRSYSCGHIATERSRAVIADLALELSDETFTFYPGVSYRHILVVKGHPELMDLAYTPPHDLSDKPIAGELPRGEGAELLGELMRRARDVLACSAANRARVDLGEVAATDIWPFWPGVAPHGLPSFAERRGLRAALTSGVDLLNGLAVLFGIDRIAVAGVTDGSDNDHTAQIEAGLAALADHDLVIVHVEAPDEEGHAGDAAAKIAAIEAIDALMVSRLRERLGDVRVLCMPDHPTPVDLKTHVGEAVPFVLAGPGVAHNGASAYDEAAAARTGLALDPGYRVMDLLLG